MSRQNLVELARSGNPKAISALLNRNLQKHNILAKVDVKGDRLKVLFEADQVPGQAKMYAFMQKGMESLKPDAINKVSLYGKAFSEDFHEWEQNFEIQKPLEIQLSSTEEVANKIRDMAKSRTESSDIEYESPFLLTQKIERSEIDNSAYCPNCGSSHLQIRKDTNVSWGRAAVGWALLGAVGGAVGAITGEDRNSVACLNCGTSWKAKDLYKIRETIKELTGKNLNLSQERDRHYLNSFISDIGPLLENVSKAKKEANSAIQKVELEKSKSTTEGCTNGCTVLFMMIILSPGAFMAHWLFGLIWLLTALIVPWIGFSIGTSRDNANKEDMEKEIKKKKIEINKIKIQAENNLKTELEKFVSSH
jgi:hypothetical protein